MAQTQPNLQSETRLRAQGFAAVCGVDEAGRGPLAGPVVAAAVILELGSVPQGLNDSKKLNPQKREALFAQIFDCAIVGIGVADVARIDRDNILQSSLWAMDVAVAALKLKPDYCLIDGNKLPPSLPIPAQAIVGGDGKSLSIAAASIIAKVTRDRMMVDYAKTYPGYGFEIHKGYGTARHLAALEKLGPCPIHRRSFAPVARVISD